MRLGALEDAQFLLKEAVRFEPDNISERIDHIRILRKRQKFEESVEQATVLLRKSPDDLQFLIC